MSESRMLGRTALTPLERAQYGRHLSLRGFGEAAQLRLKQARVLLVGAGGLGCPIGLYLAAAGVGALGVADFDRVERSNLQRQVAHTVADVGQPKTDSLIAAMQGVNPLPHYENHSVRVEAANVSALIAGYDLVIDGSDNFATRFLLGDACFLSGVPLLSGAVFEYEAQWSLFTPEGEACYRCLFERPPSRNALSPCAEVGVLGVVPGAAGLMMATVAIRFLTGESVPAQGQLALYDARNQSVRYLGLSRNQDCPLCGKQPGILQPQNIAPPCGLPDALRLDEIPVAEALARQAAGAMLLDVREPFEVASGHLPGARLLPLGQLEALIGSVLPAWDTPVVVYCQKGQRSLQAAEILQRLGYRAVASMSGGYAAWRMDPPHGGG